MGIIGNIFHNTLNCKIRLIVDVQDFPQRVVFAEVSFGHVLCNDDRIGGIQSCLGIAFYHRKREDIKHRIIDKKKAIFIEQVVSIPDRHPSEAAEPDSIDNLREILDEIVSHRRTGFGNIEVVPRNL